MLKSHFRALLTCAAVLGCASMPAHAAMTAVGPVDANHGFPTWYQAAAPDPATGLNSLQDIRLQPCFPGVGTPPATPPFCGVITPPDPTKPIHFPDNFLGEFFYWRALARVKTSSMTAVLVLATQGTFANADAIPLDGQQIAFSRIRIKISGLVPGAFYKITHPYGVGVSTNVAVQGSKPLYLQADASGTINATDNDGCGAVILPTCNFAAVETPGIPVGPWLVWDTYGKPFIAPPPPPGVVALDPNSGPPPGFIGDAVTPHKVVGSPTGNNFFKVEDINGKVVLFTDLFTVTGELALTQP